MAQHFSTTLVADRRQSWTPSVQLQQAPLPGAPPRRIDTHLCDNARPWTRRVVGNPDPRTRL